MAADPNSLERIKLIHPILKDELLAEYNYANEKLLPKGVRLRLVQTLRTFEEQHRLFLQRPKVTNADSGQSYHNYGVAFDFCILFDKDKNGTFETISWDVDKYWMEVVKYFKSKGWTWGGDFPGDFKDFPHFEKKFGYNWRELLRLYKAGNFIPGTKYVNISTAPRLASKRPIKLIKDFVFSPVE